MSDGTLLEKAAEYIDALEKRNAYLESIVDATENEKLAQARDNLKEHLKTAGITLDEDVDEVLELAAKNEKLASLLESVASTAPRRPAPLGETYRSKTASATSPRERNRAKLLNFIMS